MLAYHYHIGQLPLIAKLAMLLVLFTDVSAILQEDEIFGSVLWVVVQLKYEDVLRNVNN